jgi:hypothetical protein
MENNLEDTNMSSNEDIPNLNSNPEGSYQLEFNSIPESLEYIINMFENEVGINEHQYPASIIYNQPINSQEESIVPNINVEPEIPNIQEELMVHNLVAEPEILMEENGIVPYEEVVSPNVIADNINPEVDGEESEDMLPPLENQAVPPVVPPVVRVSNMLFENIINTVISGQEFNMIYPVINNGRIINKEYYIENINEKEVSITRIVYEKRKHSDSLQVEYEIKNYWLPTHIAIDYKNYLLRILDDINLNNILENKEIALNVALYISTGEMSEGVTNRYDEFHGLKKTPIEAEKFEELQEIDVDVEEYSDDDNCSICCVPIKEDIEGKKIIKLSCGDTFCAECIKQWLKTYSNKCPNCNTQLDSQMDDFESAVEVSSTINPDEIDINYMIAFFIVKYASFYRSNNVVAKKLCNIVNLFVSQNGAMVMDDCISIF